MSERRSIGLVVACLLLLVCVAPARAKERSYWRHSKGHFENTKGNTWVEKCPEGTFRFVETKRTEKYVELYDKSQKCTVRLYNNRCDIKNKDTKNKFKKCYDGKWAGK